MEKNRSIRNGRAASLDSDSMHLASSYLQYLERAHEGLVDGHHGPRVVELAAVVGRREERDELALGEELVPVLDDLVRATNQVEVVLVKELGRHLCAEGERHAAVVLAPAHCVLREKIGNYVY